LAAGIYGACAAPRGHLVRLVGRPPLPVGLGGTGAGESDCSGISGASDNGVCTPPRRAPVEPTPLPLGKWAFSCCVAAATSSARLVVAVARR